MSKPGFWQRVLGRSRAEPAAGEIPGASLARYRLGELLGQGAMAEVHLAVDKNSGEQVAIKRLALQREFAAEDLVDVRQRFMREARAAGHLQHPDILQILEAGEADQDAWIAMEYVRGQDLSHHTRPGQLLPVDEVVRLGARLARALAYAHAQGVVHRDIKPSNVMWDRERGTLKIMDFGIARIADGSRTRTGLVLGTPSFMSPEQLAGLRVDGRSDLYSLGVMLFQLLTGQLPHQSDSMARLMQQIATQPAPDVRRLRRGLPESLALVLALTLEKRPELRYASGDAMAQDLDAVLADLPAGDLPQPGAARQEVTAADAFARTQVMGRSEPGHNPGVSDPPEPGSK